MKSVEWSNLSWWHWHFNKYISCIFFPPINFIAGLKREIGVINVTAGSTSHTTPHMFPSSSPHCLWLRLWLWLPVMWKTCSHSPTVYLLHRLLKLSAAWQQNEWEENCAQIDPLFVQWSSKYRPEVAQHEWSEIWREGGRMAGNGRWEEKGKGQEGEDERHRGWGRKRGMKEEGEQRVSRDGEEKKIRRKMGSLGFT